MNKTIAYNSASLPGIKVLSCTSDYAFRDHIHNEHVIWLNSANGEHFSLGGNSKVLQPGSISIIEPGRVHSNRGFAGKSRHLRSLYLSPSFFSHIEKLITGEDIGKLELPTIVLKNKRYWLQLLTLHELILHNHDQMIQEQTALELFKELCDETLRCVDDRDIVNEPSSLVLSLIDFMHSNIAESIELMELAQLVNRTEFHVIRLFKKYMGMSPHAYLVQLRLEKARTLLENNVSIADAALQSGFSDQSHLTRKFKIRYGITPGVYVSSMN